MVKEEGSFEELSKNGILFQKLMENAGKMERQTKEEKHDENDAKKASEASSNYMYNEQKNDGDYANGKKSGKFVLIKQEERQTGVVSWKVLERYCCPAHDILDPPVMVIYSYYFKGKSEREGINHHMKF